MHFAMILYNFTNSSVSCVTQIRFSITIFCFLLSRDY